VDLDIRLRLVRLVIAVAYFLVAILPFLIWVFVDKWFLSPVVFGFTLYSLVWLIAPLFGTVLEWMAMGIFLFSYFLVPMFYIGVAYGLQRESKIAWRFAFVSNLLTITANLFWIVIGPSSYVLGPNSHALKSYVDGLTAGLVFNIIMTIILLFYWNTILKKHVSIKSYRDLMLIFRSFIVTLVSIMMIFLAVPLLLFLLSWLFFSLLP